jgi:hypothetical protein
MSASEVERWLGALPEGPRQEAEGLATQVRAAAPALGEAVKWGRLTFTAQGDWHHWVCAVAATKSDARLVFHKGALLDDPAGLLVGDGRYVRQMPYSRAAGDPDAVAALVRSAIARQKDLLDPG